MKTVIITMILLVAIVTPGQAKKVKNVPTGGNHSQLPVAPRMEAQLN